MTKFTVIATTSSRVKDLPIKNGQLVFIQDKGRIAFDFKDSRVFYNQITELNTEEERTLLTSPPSGYYFVIDTAVLWYYGDEWKQITNSPEEIIFIGAELPELGRANKIYVNEFERQISIWNDSLQDYVVVADKLDETTEEDIENLFV